MTSQPVDIVAHVRREFDANPPPKIAVAVSGGSDSIALLHAVVHAFQATDTQVFAVTVDHGLRPEAAKEAEFVAQVAAGLDVPHNILTWERDVETGNLQAQARAARYDLMTRWAQDKDIPILALGHTADDQAETVLMRLARSSGVDGLAGIAPRRIWRGVTLVRPFLAVTRQALRAYLTDQGHGWIDDPSNEDPRFERVRMRAAASTLAELGLTTQALSDVAENMARVREALDHYTFTAARESVRLDGGDVVMDHVRFQALPEEIARRLLIHALGWIGGGPYQPRREAVKDALSAIKEERPVTLHGCLIIPHDDQIWVCREYKAVRDLEVAADAIWDRRWRVTSEVRLPAGHSLRALGEMGLAQCETWRETGRPRPALIASPSVWKGDQVLSAPHAGLPGNPEITLTCDGDAFFDTILTH